MKKTRISALAVTAILLLTLLAGTAGAAESGPLFGKKVLFVGDSICEAQCEWHDPVYARTIGWAGRILQSYGMSGLNAAISGASVSDCRGSNTVYQQLARFARTDYDFVILHGGVNDAWDSASVGTMAAGFDGPFDTSTFAGGLETLLQFAKSRCGDAVIGYIANFQLPASEIGRLSDMSEYFDVAAQICEKWGVAYLDLYNDEDLNARVLKVNTTECLPDHIHPNSEGYNRLAPIIGEWMETLAAAPAEESPAESPAVSAVPSEVSEPAAQAKSDSTATVLLLAAAGAAVVAALILLLRRKRKSKGSFTKR